MPYQYHLQTIRSLEEKLKREQKLNVYITFRLVTASLDFIEKCYFLGDNEQENHDKENHMRRHVSAWEKQSKLSSDRLSFLENSLKEEKQAAKSCPYCV